MRRDDYDKPRPVGVKRSPRKRVLVVTEGEVTEKEYFVRLKTFLELKKPQLEVHVENSSKGSTPTRVVQSAKQLKAEAAERQKQLNELGSLEAREEFDEVWVVFDTESYTKNPDLKPAAESAEKDGMKVAISRPSFESWFLLHLRDGLPAMETCANVVDAISSETKRQHGRRYRKKCTNNEDLKWLIQTILPMTKTAIERSARIAPVAFADHHLVPSQSGTRVHELVRVLWSASQQGSRGAASDDAT